MSALRRRYGRALPPGTICETKEVLAGAYEGGRRKLDEMLTHSAVAGTEDAICHRVRPGGLCDRVLNEPPTCPRCFKLDPRFAGQKPPPSPVTKQATVKSAKPGDRIAFTSLLGQFREGTVVSHMNDGYRISGADPYDFAPFSRVVSINGQAASKR